MPSYTTKLLDRFVIAEDSMAFVFAKPKNFVFKAGQYANFSIDLQETDAEGDNRFFSLASPPYEDKLMIATRMRDSVFKRTLQAMPLGSEVRIKGPYGKFALHEDAGIPAVFLTGGIGITPVRSMLYQAAKLQLTQPIYLFYANHRPEDSAFLQEIIALTKENLNFHFIATMTQMQNSKHEWEGEQGVINEKMLIKYLGDLSKPIFYLSGPAAMVASLRHILLRANVSEVKIHTEEFSGY